MGAVPALQALLAGTPSAENPAPTRGTSLIERLQSGIPSKSDHSVKVDISASALPTITKINCITSTTGSLVCTRWRCFHLLFQIKYFLNIEWCIFFFIKYDYSRKYRCHFKVLFIGCDLGSIFNCLNQQIIHRFFCVSRAARHWKATQALQAAGDLPAAHRLCMGLMSVRHLTSTLLTSQIYQVWWLCSCGSPSQLKFVYLLSMFILGGHICELLNRVKT